MKPFRFDELWLLSEGEGKARRLRFRPGRNALVGTNHTGKSTALRLLYSAFGCSHRPLGGEWRSNAAVAVKFTVGSAMYTILRRSKNFALFDASNTLMWATRDQGVLRDKFSELLGFVLALSPNKPQAAGEIVATRQARPAYFFVPFFVDQDGSWDSKWSTFVSLGEFSQWERPTLDLALGIRPSSYWVTLGELTAKKAEVQETVREQKVLEAAREKLAEQFPRTPFFRNAMQFRAELKKLEQQAGQLSAAQDDARARMADAVTNRDALETQLKLIEGALGEHSADMRFLDTQKVGRDIPCPTCGTMHEHSFHERLNLEAEADELRQLRATMRAGLLRAQNHYQKVTGELEALDAQAKQVDDLLNVQRGELKLREVVDRAGINRAHEAFEKQRETLDLDLGRLKREENELQEKLNSLEDPGRARMIQGFFNETYAQFANDLKVPASLRTRKGAVQRRPQQGGSGGPRAVLAYYFALSHTAERFSPAVLPALVIDSPHQKAQDEIKRPMVTEFIFRNRVPGQQLIVGLEEDLPDTIQLGDNDTRTILDREYGLLHPGEYDEVLTLMEPLVAAAAAYLEEVEGF